MTCWHLALVSLDLCKIVRQVFFLDVVDLLLLIITSALALSSPGPSPLTWSQLEIHTLAQFFTCCPWTTGFGIFWPACWKYRFGSLSQTFRISWDESWELLSHWLLVVVREGPLESFPSSEVRKSSESPWAPTVCWCWNFHGKEQCSFHLGLALCLKMSLPHGTCSKWACMSISTHWAEESENTTDPRKRKEGNP